jgi:uncharacterized protein (UPF0332 family)
MSFEWSDYLGLAQELLSHSQSYQQARWRSSVSRAYYAAYHEARDFLLSQGILIQRDQAHSQVINELAKLGPQAFNISESLRRLRAKRNFADYDKNTFASKLSDYESIILMATTITYQIHRLRQTTKSKH